MTAVEWLFLQLYEKFEMKGDGREMDKVLEQAKAMEWKQLVDACGKKEDTLNQISNIPIGEVIGKKPIRKKVKKKDNE